MAFRNRPRVGAWLTGLAVLAVTAGSAPAQPAAVPNIKEIEDAGAALQKGQVEEALKLLQEAVKKKPELPPAKLMLARLFLRGNTREAVQQGRMILEQVAGENSDHPDVYLTGGVLALSEGRLSEALLNCQKAFDLATAGRWSADQKKRFLLDARTGLAAASEARRDWTAARTHLAAWLDMDPKNAQIRTRYASALFYLDKPDEAFLELQTAVRDDPNLEPPTVTMGRLWTSKGKFKEAREWLDKAIKAEPNSARVHLAYADWLLQQNEIEQAKVHADTAAKIKPNDTDVLKAQGLIARIQKDLVTAEKLFKQIQTAVPSDVFASNQLALTLVDQTDKEQRNRGVQLAEVNARQYPRSAEAAATLGYAYSRIGNLDAALQALQAATSSGQAHPDTAYYLALVLSERDKADVAIKYLEDALKAQGLFAYRKPAQELLDALKKKQPAKDKPKGP